MSDNIEQTTLVLVTGMSGAGKTQAMRALEDMGFFCIDNYPFSMIEDLFNHVLIKRIGLFPKVAIAADVRGKEFLQDIEMSLARLKKKNINCHVVYMDADDATLMNRYKETRRKHPLQDERSITEAIAEERRILSPIREQADRIVDSSNMKVTEFKTLLYDLYGNREAKMTITVASFGFKYGLPLDSDLVFDVRFLPNPYYDPNMRLLTGKDPIVRDYVLQMPETKTFLDSLNGMLSFLVPEYVREGKKQLVISIGCTGGQHRSVAIADAIAKSLNREDVGVIVKHRELHKYQ
jgi:UPF0042 nucleotide-binding protein